MSERRVTVERRFHGPPDSGNGGYVAGLVARELGGSGCAVTLHRPPPLEQQLAINRSLDSVSLMDGEELVASAAAGAAGIAVPAPPSIDQAQAAERDYVGHHRHRFPDCFVCGPDRAQGDGLRIFPGLIGAGRVASTWTPAPDLAGKDGYVRSEFLWAALDCPGYFAVEEAAGLALLGRMTAVIERPVAAGTPLVVSGWAIASEGRKHQVGTALHLATGEIVAKARSTWITVRA